MTGRRVVIIGAGFAGLSAAMALVRTKAEVVVVDRRNHHLFQPLLYQVATAGLAPTQIASPIRMLLGRAPNVRIELDEVTAILPERREVALGARTIPYDHLIVAAGASTSHFGREDWAASAPGLKSLEDALALRRRILLALEQAELDMSEASRRRLLTFVVVGGGPTGVEVAGAIAELTQRALACDFRHIRGQRARIILIDGGTRLLANFCPDLSGYARRALEALGVEVVLGARVSACDAGGVTAGELRFEADTVIWAAGVAASPLCATLGAPLARGGRLMVAPDLTVPGHPEVFVVGDCAHVSLGDGRAVPGLAPAAKQAGAYAARVVLARIEGRPAPPPFRYSDQGALATIGRVAAVADFGRLKLTGLPAWLVWCVAHVWFLIGFRNRLQVTLDWIWSYLTFERGARLVFEAVTRRSEPVNPT